MPSLCVEHDNAIGKKKQVATPATHDEASKLKRGKSSDAKATAATKNKWVCSFVKCFPRLT